MIVFAYYDSEKHKKYQLPLNTLPAFQCPRDQDVTNR